MTTLVPPRRVPLLSDLARHVLPSMSRRLVPASYLRSMSPRAISPAARERVLVVAAEQMTRALDWTDRATCVLFGDGAGAAVIEAGGENPLAVELSTSPDVETLRVPGLAGSSPYKAAQDCESVLSMNGRRVFKFGVNAICDTVNKLARRGHFGRRHRSFCIPSG
ncbi:MAG: hypothetical protein ACLS3M_09285 [Collinsella sp.]